MKVVILAGGFGTRIRDVASDIPKPMIPIGPYPILWHIMRSYSYFGHKHFIICLGYKGELIKQFFLNYKAYTHDITISYGNTGGVIFHNAHNDYDWTITLSDTGARAMTGARIARIKEYVGNEDFMLTYGDGVSDVNINQLLEFHRSHDKVLTVTGVRPPGRFGEMMAQDNGQVTEFNEKPQASGGRISGGFFVARPSLFDYLEDCEDLVFEEGPVRNLVADGQLMMFAHDGFWQPMDTSREYVLLNSMYEKGITPWIR